MRNKTYGAGFRAGMSPKPIINRRDGTKVLSNPVCPFKGRWQVVQRVMWQAGYDDGLRKSLQTWLKGKL